MMMKVRYVMIILLAICFEICKTSDICDWTGSGSPEMVESRGVQPVYLRCSQGTLRWHYPRGALRVVLRQGLSGNNFRACFKMSANSSGARVYLASRRKLHPVFSNSKPSDIIRCVNSRDGHLALYVEADPMKDPLLKRLAQFSYHLKKIPDITNTTNVDDECRPCGEDELLQNFCTSDFVVKGTVSSLFHNYRLQRSEISIRATKIYQDSNPSLFRTLSNDIVSNISRKEKYATMYRSIQCGTKSGSGEYLFFGRWILGNPTLTCIPRLTEWKKVRRKALQAGTFQCQLEL